MSTHAHLLIPTASLLVAAVLPAQVDTRPSPEQALQAKLASPFLGKAPWLTDYDAALAAARQRHTLIFGYFTTANY